MRARTGSVWLNAASTSAIGGHNAMALGSRSLRPSRAIVLTGPSGSGPRSIPSHPANTGPVLSGTRGLTSNTGVPVRSLSTSVRSVPVPRPMQVIERTQAGTSAPSLAARACQSSGKPSCASTIRKTAPASADPPPSPAATGKFFSSVTAQPGPCGRALSALPTILLNGSVSCVANSPIVLSSSCAATVAETTSPASTNANSVSSS